MDDIAKLKERLSARLKELDELEKQGAEERATVTLDQQAIGRLARMDLMQRQQMAEETLRRRKLERRKLEAAIRRVDADEFGWCAECGEPIAPRRLAFDPPVALCLDCAR